MENEQNRSVNPTPPQPQQPTPPAPTNPTPVPQTPEQQPVVSVQSDDPTQTSAPTIAPMVMSGAVVAEHHRGSKKWLVIVLVVVVAALVAGGGLYALKHGSNNSNTSTSSTDCQAPTGALTDSSAEAAYGNFVKAIKSNSQQCVDNLSTTVFQKVQSQTFGAPDGNWLTKKTSLPSGLDDFRKLPATLNNQNFSTEEYVRPNYSAFQGLENAGQPQGIEVKYKLPNSGHGYSLNLDLAFVKQANKILVDELQVAPDQIDN
jgi:hypothetical protein